MVQAGADLSAVYKGSSGGRREYYNHRRTRVRYASFRSCLLRQKEHERKERAGKERKEKSGRGQGKRVRVVWVQAG